jgi:hypothetical protein
MPTYVEPETGDLHARTEGRTPALTYMSTSIENTLILNRGNNEVLNLAVQHYDTTRQLHLVVFNGDPDFPEIKQEVELSFDEVKLLRALLDRPEVSAILEQGGKA